MLKKSILALLLCTALFMSGCGNISDTVDTGDQTDIVSDHNFDYVENDDHIAISEEASADFAAYVNEHLTLMGTIMCNMYMFDVTGDGFEDICSTYFTGSGMISTLIVVYDIQEKQGYMLNDRCVYDYMIKEALPDGQPVVSRTNWGDRDSEVLGSIVFEEDEIFFDDGLDKKGLSFKALKLFEDAAIYLPAGETGYGDYFSSRNFSEIREFLLCVDDNNVQLVHGRDDDHDTILYRISYEALYDILVKIYKEQNIEKVIEKMDESYQEEMAVYYDPQYGYIYRETDSIEYFDFYTNVVNVDKNGSEYTITYEVYSGAVNADNLISTVDVTIEEADNRFGYCLVRIEK